MFRSFWFKKIAFSLIGAVILALGQTTSAATLSLTPAAGGFTVGDSFNININVNSAGQALNAVSGTINFPTARLEVINLSKAGSLIAYWVAEPGFSNATGVIKFEGVTPNPGFTGATGKVLTIRFRAKQVGSAILEFVNGSVLANDGNGTNILQNLSGAELAIKAARVAPPANQATTLIGAPTAPEITSTTHPDPSKWYADDNPSFSWRLSSDITGVNILADREPNTNPGTKADGLFSSYRYEAVDDGVWYFHLRFRNDSGWGDVSHFAFRIDTAPPTDFKISEVLRSDATDPIAKFQITASDTPSGVDRYELSLDGGPAVSRPDSDDYSYQLGPVKPGSHSLLAKVYDFAGNSLAGSVDFIISPLAPPTVTDYPKELTTDDRLRVKGYTDPGATVYFSIKDPTGSVNNREVEADALGNFLLAFETSLREGVYSYSATVRDRRGAESLSSPNYLTLVAAAPWLRLGQILVKWLSLIIPLLALLFLLVVIVWYSWRKSQNLKRTLRRESREATETTHQAFDFLRRRARNQLALIETAGAKRDLTKEEEILAKSLRQSLDQVEQSVQKEISDIERAAE